MLIGRLIIGLAIGISSSVVPVYISECSPINYRGTNVAVFNCMICFGQMVSYGISYMCAGNWRMMIGLGAVFPLVSSLLFVWLPESPKLLFKTGRMLDTLQAIKTLISDE